MITVASTTAPIRELVYGFTWESQQTIAARDSKNPAEDPNFSYAGSGINYYHGNLGDRGTIKVGVLREQPDTGLVVVVSEQGLRTRNALPATCVVYGTTNVLCDPNATVNPEEYTLLRFLGEKFIDSSRVDDKGRWQYDETNNDIRVKAAYRIVSVKGDDVTISEVRDISQVDRITMTTEGQTTIHYNSARLAPLSVDEYVTQREDHGVNGTVTTIFQTTLTLQSDSLTTASTASQASTATSP